MIKLSQGARGHFVILIRRGMHPVVCISDVLRWNSWDVAPAKKNRLVGGLVCKINKGSSVRRKIHDARMCISCFFTLP